MAILRQCQNNSNAAISALRALRSEYNPCYYLEPVTPAVLVVFWLFISIDLSHQQVFFFMTVTATTFSSAAIVWCFVLPDNHSPDQTVLQTRGNSLKNKRRISLHNYVKIINRKNWPWLERTLFIGWTSYLLFLFQIRSHKCKYQVCFTCWRNLWNCDLCQVCGPCLRISNATISALSISLQHQKLWMWQWVPFHHGWE